jgi:hypothetical protein
MTPMKPAIVGINPDGDANLVKVGELNGIKASLDKLEKMALIDKSSTENIGGNKTTTNDSELMKFIFDKIGYIIGGILTFLLSFFGGVWALFRFIMSQNERILKAKDLWIENLLKSNASKEEKLDLWQQRLIEESLKKTNERII